MKNPSWTKERIRDKQGIDALADHILTRTPKHSFSSIEEIYVSIVNRNQKALGNWINGYEYLTKAVYQKLIKRDGYLKFPETKNFKLVDTPQIERLDTDNGRFYRTPSGLIVPSVTTVLSTYENKKLEDLERKIGSERMAELRSRGAKRGDGFHKAVESLLEGKEELPKNLISKELYLKAKSTIEKNVSDPLLIEQQLWSEDLQVAGTLDLIAEWNGKLSLIDWKTASYKKAKDEIETYYMQTFMYTYMIHERIGIKLDQIVIFIAVEDEDPQIFITTPNEHAKKTVAFLQEYRQKNTFVYQE